MTKEQKEKIGLIRKYLPYGQFAAVVFTIVIGIHTLIERFLEPDGDPIAFTPDEFVVSEGESYGVYNINFGMVMLRHDCQMLGGDVMLHDKDDFEYTTVVSRVNHISNENWSTGFRQTGESRTNMAEGEYHVIFTMIYECPKLGKVYVKHPSEPTLTYWKNGGFKFGPVEPIVNPNSY